MRSEASSFHSCRSDVFIARPSPPLSLPIPPQITPLPPHPLVTTAPQQRPVLWVRRPTHALPLADPPPLPPSPSFYSLPTPSPILPPVPTHLRPQHCNYAPQRRPMLGIRRPAQLSKLLVPPRHYIHRPVGLKRPPDSRSTVERGAYSSRRRGGGCGGVGGFRQPGWGQRVACG